MSKQQQPKKVSNTMTKHTTAPWHVGEKYPEDVYANRAGHAIVRCINPQYEGECEVNARLISAAPELLIVSMELTKVIIDICTSFGIPLPVASLNLSNIAIKKATSKTK
jgi:hypothetical protein